MGMPQSGGDPRRGLNQDFYAADPRWAQVWREIFFTVMLTCKIVESQDKNAGPVDPLKEPIGDYLLSAWWSVNRTAGLFHGRYWDQHPSDAGPTFLRKAWESGRASISQTLDEISRHAVGETRGLGYRYAVIRAAHTTPESLTHPLIDY